MSAPPIETVRLSFRNRRRVESILFDDVLPISRIIESTRGSGAEKYETCSIDWEHMSAQIQQQVNATREDLVSDFSEMQAATESEFQSMTVMITGELEGKEPLISAGTAQQYFSGDKTWRNLDKTAVGLSLVDNTADQDKPASSAVAAALAAKLEASRLGAADGVAPLGGDGKVPALFLPSYVDDVLEFGTYAQLPAQGEGGKLYIVADTGFEYRWSGSTYARLVSSPGSTDALPEGSVNQYFTALRAAVAAPVQTVAGKTGNVVLGKADVGLSNVDNTRDADKPVSSLVSVALAGKIDSSAIGAANGIVPLGSDSKINSTFLPSYVDDVVEADSFGALPATGEKGKIYVTVDTNREYRWSGSAYIQIAASPGSTDAVAEGSNNLYFTQARAVTALGASLSTEAANRAAAISSAIGTEVADRNTAISNAISTELTARQLGDTNEAAARAAADALKVQLYNNGPVVSAPKTFFASKAVTVAGSLIFYLTADATASGAAIFGTSVLNIQPVVNDATTLYTFGWVVSADRKTLTVTVNKSNTPILSLLGINILQQPTAAPVGTVVQILAIGY